jgi:uncharacterized protein YecE (DUF72 family)
MSFSRRCVVCARSSVPFCSSSPFFRGDHFGSVQEFLAVLEPFLGTLPDDLRCAVEVRNREWIGKPLLDALRAHQVAFALTDRATTRLIDHVTASFVYVRWLGNRAGIEEITKTFDRTVIDRSAELSEWAKLLTELRRRAIPIYGYVNNHFAGHSPETIRRLLDLLAPEQRKPRRHQPATLFEM